MQPQLQQAATVFAFVSQPIVAEGLARILENCAGLEFAGFCADPRLVNEELVRLKPGLLLVDQSFGLRTLFELLETARYGRTPARIVIWSRTLAAAECRQLLDAGASGVIEKTEPPAVLLDCLRAVAAGRTWTGAAEAGAALIDRRVAMRLTQRERQVLALLAEGLKNREIAQRLSITPGTVKVHLMHIFEKSGVRNRHELGMQAHHFLSPAPGRKEPDTEAPKAAGHSAAEAL